MFLMTQLLTGRCTARRSLRHITDYTLAQFHIYVYIYFVASGFPNVQSTLVIH